MLAREMPLEWEQGVAHAETETSIATKDTVLVERVAPLSKILVKWDLFLCYF